MKRTDDSVHIEIFNGETKLFSEENFATFVNDKGHDIAAGYLIAVEDICASLQEILHPTKGSHAGFIETSATVRSKLEKFLMHKQSVVSILKNESFIKSNRNSPDV